MKFKQKSFHEIMDVYAFRIITDTEDNCYRILGAVHSLYKPLPGRFKDYIAMPSRMAISPSIPPCSACT